MLNISKINNVNFQGYKNVIANSIRQPDLDISMLTLKLDNNGIQDLENYRKIQDLIDNKTYTTPQDTLTIIAYGEPNKIYVALDGIQIPTDHTLIAMEKYANKGFLNKDEFKKDETKALKIYTFLAQLTKRIANDNNLINEKATFIDVIVNTILKLNNIFNNDTNATTKFVNQAVQRNKPHETAQAFNELIQKMMKNYLLR